MQAGAAMAVVGWWTGYKLGGVIALNVAEYFQQIGFTNYWQITFLILGIVIIACNIGLMFVHEEQPTERQQSQKITDQMIEEKLGSSNAATKSIAWISGTIAGPIISFFKKNGYLYCPSLFSGEELKKMVDINAYLHKDSNKQFTQLHNDKKAWPIITNQKIVDICKEITEEEKTSLLLSINGLAAGLRNTG